MLIQLVAGYLSSKRFQFSLFAQFVSLLFRGEYHPPAAEEILREQQDHIATGGSLQYELPTGRTGRWSSTMIPPSRSSVRNDKSALLVAAVDRAGFYCS